MSYDDILEALARGEIRVKTLGGQSEVTFFRDGAHVWIRTSTGNTHEVKQTVWDAVLARVEELRQHAPAEVRMAARYGLQGWEECPDKVVCPYIPALLAHLGDL